MSYASRLQSEATGRLNVRSICYVQRKVQNTGDVVMWAFDWAKFERDLPVSTMLSTGLNAHCGEVCDPKH